jgi:hypothetical protein
MNENYEESITVGFAKKYCKGCGEDIAASALPSGELPKNQANRLI